MGFFEKEVIVCKKCGEKFSANSKFCPNCGEPVEGTKKIERQVFAGQVRKCPNCGTEIGSYTVICPGCGIELGNLEGHSSSLTDFSQRIADYDSKIGSHKGGGWKSWSTLGKIGWILLNIYLVCIPLLIYNSKKKKSNYVDYSAEKRSFIENYIFPNDRQSILDALIYMKERIYSLTVDGITRDDYEWAKVWKNKAGHLYQQAELLFPGDQIANKTYNEAEQYYNQIAENFRGTDETMQKIKMIAIYIFAGLFGLSFLAGFIKALFK